MFQRQLSTAVRFHNNKKSYDIMTYFFFSKQNGTAQRNV